MNLRKRKCWWRDTKENYHLKGIYPLKEIQRDKPEILQWDI